MTYQFDDLLNQYIPPANRLEFFTAHPSYQELVAQEVDKEAKSAFIIKALGFLGLPLPEIVKTPLEVAIEAPEASEAVAEVAAVVAPEVAPVVSGDMDTTVVVPKELINVVNAVLTATPDQLVHAKAALSLPA